MEIDPVEPAQSAAQEAEAARDKQSARLSTWVAITVALLATFMGICKVKDDNIVQGMQQAQADKLDHWNFYQARNIRQDVATATATQLRLAAAGAPASQQESYRGAIASYETLAADQGRKKEDLRAQAEQDQKNYDALNYRDDQFDLSDALVALAISLLALTALTQKRWLFFLALAPTFLGVLMGLAGIFGWNLHPDAIARMLS